MLRRKFDFRITYLSSFEIADIARSHYPTPILIWNIALKEKLDYVDPFTADLKIDLKSQAADKRKVNNASNPTNYVSRNFFAAKTTKNCFLT